MRQSGFTLLELSIVLVIIGLIIGGVTVGSEMIRQAELQSVIKDMKNYESVIHTYRLKYQAVPGDHNKATSYWPSGTSNGNGDGSIGDHNDTGAALDEDGKVWQHLALAGLLNMAPATSLWPQVIGTNMPASRLNGAGYRYQSGDGATPFNRTQFHMVVGTTNSCFDLYCPVFLPAESYSLDQKIDDGLPMSGMITGESYYTPEDCIVGATSGNRRGSNAYALDKSSVGCNLMYWYKQ